MRRRLQREVWEALGRDDGDWAVLTVPERRQGGWAENLDAFYTSGVDEIAECLKLAEPRNFAKALDYGAGTGRLSQALASKFGEVTSLDVSDAMLETLRQRAGDKGVTNISASLVDDFVPYGDHDFAISLLVLQHLPTRAAVADAVALIAQSLRPGGVGVLEIPERALLFRAKVQPRFRLYTALRMLGFSPGKLHQLGYSGISMLTIDGVTARAMFERCGLTVVDQVARPDRDYNYIRWVVRRNG